MEEQNNSVKKEEKREPVVIGKAVQKKKSAGRSIVESFVNEDAETIKSHILFDIIIPYIKDMISAGFHAAVDMLLYGNGGGPVRTSNGRRVISSSSGPRDYNAISKQKKYADRSNRPQMGDDIAFEERGDANNVLDALCDLINDFGQCSVYDYYEASGLTCDYTYKNYGWYDLNTAVIQLTRDGDYIIRMPKPLLLK